MDVEQSVGVVCQPACEQQQTQRAAAQLLASQLLQRWFSHAGWSFDLFVVVSFVVGVVVGGGPFELVVESQQWKSQQWKQLQMGIWSDIFHTDIPHIHHVCFQRFLMCSHARKRVAPHCQLASPRQIEMVGCNH